MTVSHYNDDEYKCDVCCSVIDDVCFNFKLKYQYVHDIGMKFEVI